MRRTQIPRTAEVHTTSRYGARRGAVLVWFVFVIPLMLMILLALTDFSGASLAKIELRNASDAAALSAIKTWDRGDIVVAASDAEAILMGNIQTSGILSRAVTESLARDDLSSTATVVTFGTLTTRNGVASFTAGIDDLALLSAGADTIDRQRCVLVQKTLHVPSIGGTWLGVSFGPYTVTTESFARISPHHHLPQLVFVDAVTMKARP